MTKKLKFLIKDLILFGKVADKENEQAYNYVVKELIKEINKSDLKLNEKILKDYKKNNIL